MEAGVNDLPAPLTPEWLDGSKLGLMPFDAEAYIVLNRDISADARINAARIALMADSWLSKPAASLENLEYAYLTIWVTKRWWNANYSKVLKPWTLCSDGRYYHRWLAEQANKRISKTHGKSRIDISAVEWRKLREQVFKRDGNRCVYCGETPPRLHCDHIIPLARGGKSELANLATACADCNLSKNATVLEDWIAASKAPQ